MLGKPRYMSWALEANRGLPAGREQLGAEGKASLAKEATWTGAEAERGWRKESCF